MSQDTALESRPVIDALRRNLTAALEADLSELKGIVSATPTKSGARIVAALIDSHISQLLVFENELAKRFDIPPAFHARVFFDRRGRGL